MRTFFYAINPLGKLGYWHFSLFFRTERTEKTDFFYLDFLLAKKCFFSVRSVRKNIKKLMKRPVEPSHASARIVFFFFSEPGGALRCFRPVALLFFVVYYKLNGHKKRKKGNTKPCVCPSVNHVCLCEGTSGISARFRMRGRKAVLVAEKGAQKDGMSREEKGGKIPPLSAKMEEKKG